MNNNKTGFIGAILVLAVAVTIAALGLLVYTQNKETKSEVTNAVVATTTPAMEKQDDPAELAKKFYNKYLERIRTDFGTGADKVAYYKNSPEKYSKVVLVKVNYDNRKIGDKMWIFDTDIIFDNSYVTKKFIDSIKDLSSKDPGSDLITCAQDFPKDDSEFLVKTLSNDGLKAKVNVSLSKDWGPIPVYMVNNNGWKIDKIACGEK